MSKGLLFLFVFFINGCAYLFQSNYQDLTVTTLNDNHIDTFCMAKNEEGIWKSIIPQQTIFIHRDGNVMDIVCENENQIGMKQVSPDFMGNMLMADIFFDVCTISCLIDGTLNTFYEYPMQVNVRMTSK